MKLKFKYWQTCECCVLFTFDSFESGFSVMLLNSKCGDMLSGFEKLAKMSIAKWF
jgi:hypothetical protein